MNPKRLVLIVVTVLVAVWVFYPRPESKYVALDYSKPITSVQFNAQNEEQVASTQPREPTMANPASAAQNPVAAKPSTSTNVEKHPGRWVGGMYVFPIGPCTMIVKLGGSYWFTLPHNDTRYYSEDIDSAKEAASAACDEWYANEIAGRLAVQRANEELARQHPRPQPLDLNKPLFTREGTLVCPSWEALEYAATSKLDGWKRTNYLLGVKDPIPQGQGPHVGEPVSAEYYGCSIYKDGVPVQMRATSWTGVGPKTSIGWLDPMELRN